MPIRIDTEMYPILLWLHNLDHDTHAQARNLANLPFVHHHIAIMPDAHVGYGMPIGGVAALDGMIIPNAVGVDIGCGVGAVETSLERLDKTDLKKLMSEFRKVIPLGFKHHKSPQDHSYMPGPPFNKEIGELPVVSREYDNGREQIGTLGGGNHFIEIQRADTGRIWLMVHSGSRNIGYQVANHYNHLAIELGKRNKSGIPSKWQLDPLPFDSEEGQLYFHEMQYCVAFAAANRKTMLERLISIISDLEPGANLSPILDIAHNYAAIEDHFGKKVIVHRKGATKALYGERGIIPGSQGSTSYIVKGRSNPDSFCSCSHGAGRQLGRNQARKHLNLSTEIERLERQGILHSIRHKKDLDEAAGAYKDIREVMKNQRDLVNIDTTLEPLAVIKG